MKLRATESDCQTAIIEAAMIGGWLCHAERPARTAKGYRTAIQGHAGWPDVVFLRPPRMLIVEFKRKPNEPTQEQWAWLNALCACGIDARLVYVPEEQESLIKELTS